MDSLTQIILGAAVGEATLGKKVGNRAMVWGAIAGTIPDLDVISNAFMSPIDALAFHRGPTHSFMFSILFAILLGWLIHHMYKLYWHKWLGIISWSILVAAIGLSVIFIGNHSFSKIILGIVFLSGFGYLIFKRYHRSDYTTSHATVRQWQWMFFMSLVTHPILDCFTTYGTQFLLPFSSMRVAFNNIAVADPLYTGPFMICLIIAMFYKRTNPSRAKWNNAGLIISSIYMTFTIVNKTRVNTIFENSLLSEGITFSRYMTTPTILNNILWSGIAETDSAYYYGMYSYFDEVQSFKIQKLDKNREEIGFALDTDPTLRTLRWFSDDYFVLYRNSVDSLSYFDLRFGTFKMKASDPEQFVFKFNIEENPPSTFILKDQGNRPRDANFGEAFAALWERMMGKT